MASSACAAAAVRPWMAKEWATRARFLAASADLEAALDSAASFSLRVRWSRSEEALATDPKGTTGLAGVAASSAAFKSAFALASARSTISCSMVAASGVMKG